MSEQTTFQDKASILADLWLNYRQDVEFADFIEYNDIGLPLAYAIANDIVATTPIATNFVEETFSLLLEGLDVEEDTGFETLDGLLESSEQ